MTRQTVNTVTGPINIEELGVTLMHEHLLVGYPGWEADTLHPGLSRDEMLSVCVDKIQSMQSEGIQSMLDPCPNDLGRDVQLAAEVSARTGFNIICATGLYKEDEGGAGYWHFTRSLGRGVEAMSELFIHELTVGIGNRGEFMALLASFNPLEAIGQTTTFRVFMVVGAVGTVLTAGYMLYMLRNVNFGEPSEEWLNKKFDDVDTAEWLAWAPLVIGTLVIGIFPKLVFGATNQAVINLVETAFGG